MRPATPSVRRRVRDSGYAAVLTALLLVPLLGFAGFAVDVGAWYSRASSLQRAADAAALAGVVWQPNFASAEAAARAAASRNGFTHGVDNIEVNITDPGNNRLEVEIIDTDADLYFAGLFLDSVRIGRSATSESINPVALGSPGNSLGQQMPNGCSVQITNDPTACHGPGPHPGFFLDIGGPTAPHSGGEPITTQCLASYEFSCDFLNPQYNADGYTFAIDVPPAAVGSPITVEIFDPSHADWTTSTKGTGPPSPTGLPIYHPTFSDGSTNRQELASVEYSVFDADGISLTTPKNTPLAGCTQVFDPAENPLWDAQWVTLCTFTPTVADIFPLQVRVAGFAGANMDAFSQDAYSMRVTSTAGTQPSLYALEYFPVLSNSTVTTQFDFAEIEERHAGKTIRMLLFDAGDGAGSDDFWLYPRDPSDTFVPAGDCRYRAYAAFEDPATKTWQSSDDATSCAVQTRDASATFASRYNDRWLEIEIDLDLSYTCGSDCWWSVFYDLGASGVFYERTTWSVEIVGDPVRLLE